jgi:hypothetical protein
MWSSLVLHVRRCADYGSAGGLAYLAPAVSYAATQMAPPLIVDISSFATRMRVVPWLHCQWPICA